LHPHYQSPDKINQLLDQGDISSLAENIGTEPHGFDGPRPEGICTFYARDRGDPDCDAQEVGTLKELFKMARECCAEYVYVFADDLWWVSDHISSDSGPTNLHELFLDKELVSEMFGQSE
jgi:hypothetical protein